MTEPIHVVRGNTITLTAYFHTSLNVLADAVNALVNVVDPNGVTIVANSSAWTHVATGTYTFTWAVPSTALLGPYHVNWSGQVNGDDAEGSEEIVVDPEPEQGRVCSGWVDVATVRACCSGLPATGVMPDSAIANAIEIATDLLYTLSGQQYSGRCTVKVRPCTSFTCFAAFTNVWANGLGGYAPTDESSWDPRGCSCATLARVDLGYWPVQSITSVKIDGVEVDPATYRLDSKRFLTRMANADGTNDGWPCHQRLDLNDSETDTWSVSFEYGEHAPAAGRNAAAKLACEIAKACANIPCNLPGRVTNAVRQGVSFTLMDPGMLKDGLTGLYEVDLFLIAYNPGKARGLTTVYSPDIGPSAIHVG